jgi:hypothetical protein
LYGSHCIHLEKISGQHRCGSGDKGMEWLEMIIREKWKLEPKRPPEFLVFEHYGERIAE